MPLKLILCLFFSLPFACIWETEDHFKLTVKMAQMWKVVEFTDKGAAVVPSSWLEEAGESWRCYWPGSYDHWRLQKSVLNHLPPGQNWDVFDDVRVLVGCATYGKAKDYLDKCLQPDCATTDLQSEAEIPDKRKRRANPRYKQGSNLERAGSSVTARSWSLPREAIGGEDTDEDEPTPRKTARPAIDFGPDINSEWLFGSSTTQRDSHEGHFTQDARQPHQQLLRDIGLTKVIQLLSQVLDENRQMKEEISKLGSDIRALRREMVRQATPEASPSNIKLSLNTMEEFEQAEALIKENPLKKQKMISTFTLVGGHTAEVTVRRMLQNGLTNNLASLFNWAGKGHKKPFKETMLSDVLYAALQKQLPGSTIMIYEGTVKKWLKYVPERDGGVGRRSRPAQDQAPS
ncbi:uncharacterized protein LOC121685350 isoform X1 [Alosa sapidissima]|uniref:uncharacterized protein LOC121685350 isoform X1 n=2 Tax=Alosa sapidissima TaxID=34773 RepID=UPI001C081246|nr:uncharacterized protein LOC121685350 isoform X1 [Alosa sapidissima]